MGWYDILKIKTRDGNFMKVKDVNKFIQSLRADLRDVALRYYGVPGRVSGKPRKSNIVVKENWLMNGDLELVISVRHSTSEGREYYKILLREDEEGDFYYVTASGPTLNLTRNSVLDSEFDLMDKITDAVDRSIEIKEREVKDLRDTSDEEGRQTGAEVRAEVASANPGYIMIEGKMHNLETLKEKAENQGIDLETLVRQMGGTLE